MKFFPALFFSFCFLGSWAQSIVKHELADTEGYYVAIAPPAEAKGMIVFFPGFNQSAENLLRETDFEDLAYIHGLVSVVIPIGPKPYADGEVVKTINQALLHAKETYKPPHNKVVVGGFSSGGTIGLRFAQYCLQFPKDYPVIPKAVFAVDSPVDLIQLYEYFEREIARDFSTPGIIEAKFVKKIMDEELKGSPSDNRNLYEALSPFTYGKENGGNAFMLKNTPVRVYHDANIQWQLSQRRRNFYDMNIAPASAMISELMLLGNDRAELMMTVGTGVRSTGEAHPHSMSIVEETELIRWICKHLEIPMNAAFVKKNGTDKN